MHYLMNDFDRINYTCVHDCVIPSAIQHMLYEANKTSTMIQTTITNILYCKSKLADGVCDSFHFILLFIAFRYIMDTCGST